MSQISNEMVVYSIGIKSKTTERTAIFLNLISKSNPSGFPVALKSHLKFFFEQTNLLPRTTTQNTPFEIKFEFSFSFFGATTLNTDRSGTKGEPIFSFGCEKMCIFQSKFGLIHQRLLENLQRKVNLTSLLP